MADNLFDIDILLNNAFQGPTLKELFENKLKELKISKTNVQEILDMPYRTLNGILEGTQKLVDVTNLIKLADFLQIPKEHVFKLYVQAVQFVHPTEATISPKKIEFIKENFDLAVLKKAGLINDLYDYAHIEKRIIRRLGFKTIYEYTKPKVDVAFSSGLFKPTNLLTRLFWIRAAMRALEEYDNPHEYDRQNLISFFPRIIWYTLNVEMGLQQVMKALFKLGITVIYQPPLQGLQLKGATFKVNDKPCVVLTNYQGFYSTLWFCLIHELYHVIFDWEDIKNDTYHLTDDDNEDLTVRERERFADKFARDYLLAPEKIDTIKPFLYNEIQVRKFAHDNHVHESIVYAIYAYKNNDRKDWARVRRYSPPVAAAIKKFDYPWTDETPLEEFVIEQKEINL